jgi:hypothetical protein
MVQHLPLAVDATLVDSAPGPEESSTRHGDRPNEGGRDYRAFGMGSQFTGPKVGPRGSPENFVAQGTK